MTAEAESTREERLINGLIRRSAKMLEREAERREDIQEADAQEAEELRRRSWGDRGKDMAGTFISTAVEEFGTRPATEALALSVKDAMDVLVHEYREEYKREGRAYARELGDLMLDRFQNDPKISLAVLSLEVFCWAIVIYLSLVTIIVLFCIVSLRRGNKRLQERFDALQKSFEALAAQNNTASVDETEA